jgi:heme oxygenase
MISMQRLRAETSALYAILRQILSPEQIASSHAAYTAMMLRVFASIWPVETYLETLVDSEAFPDQIPDQDQRFQKRTWLANDLAALGISNLPTVAMNTDLCPDRSVECAVGYLYVLERIAYDSQWTATELRRRLGITETSGGSFFAGYRSDKDDRWQAFRAWLTSLPFDERHVITAVQIAFERFIRDLR